MCTLLFQTITLELARTQQTSRQANIVNLVVALNPDQQQYPKEAPKQLIPLLSLH